jgi:hypothetical protein
MLTQSPCPSSDFPSIPCTKPCLITIPDLTAEMLGTYLPNFDYLLAARTRAEAMPV